MKRVRVYKQQLDYVVLVYVPEMDKVYVLDIADTDLIPKWIESDEKNIRWTERSNSSEKITTDLVLLLTTACNLACKYCYSEAGLACHAMSEQVARNAITYVASSTKEAGREGFSILFHGEGEPTLNWRVLLASVDYAREHAKQRGLEVHFSIATNGVYGDVKRDYLGCNLHNITISMDGPRFINDAQRRRRGGESISQVVYDSARYFYDLRHHLDFGIRATLLPERIEMLPDIVQFFGMHFPGIQLSVEPVEFVGSYKDVERQPFDGLAFAYRRAQKEAQKYNLRFWYSAVRGPRKSGFFCGVAGRSMVVGPTGMVSGCSRVSQWKHAGAREFIYGSISPDKAEPTINLNMKKHVESYAAANMPDCQGCIAYTWCRGDCRHIRFMENNDVINGVSPRCREIRTIVVGELLDATGFRKTEEYLKRYYRRELLQTRLPCIPTKRVVLL